MSIVYNQYFIDCELLNSHLFPLILCGIRIKPFAKEKEEISFDLKNTKENVSKLKNL